MLDRASARPICLGGATLGAHRHVCAFFSSRDDEYRVLLPFIKDGVDAGEKAIHIVDPLRRDEHLQRLRSVGIGADLAEQRGQLDLRPWTDAHLRDGFFDQHRTLRLIGDMRRDSQLQGFARTRFVTHMEWALETGGGVDLLLEYEATANLAAAGDPVVCVYDLARFGGDVVVDVMRTHPLVLIGGILHENPFFVAPQDFLRELRERASRRQAAAPSA
jgi:MEDS: MEthanogen/methylotroph, DcmR Sensory domain